MKLYFTGVLLLLRVAALAQTPASDRELLAGRDFGNDAAFAQYRRPGNSDRVVQLRHKSWLAQYNPVSLALKGALLGYQRLMSQQLARACPYQITCSNFSKQVIEQYGIVKGTLLSADRIMRCNRIGLLDVPQMDISPIDGTILDSQTATDDRHPFLVAVRVALP